MDSTGLMVQISFQHRLYKVQHEDKEEVFPVSPWIHFFVFYRKYFRANTFVHQVALGRHTERQTG